MIVSAIRSRSSAFVAILICGAGIGPGLINSLAEEKSERPTVVLQDGTGLLTIEPGGGSISAFEFRDVGPDPLVWGEAETADNRAVGHFLCLDRWGAPSEAEAKRGMFFHGEATRVRWDIVDSGIASGYVKLHAKLPIAGLSVRRDIRLLSVPSQPSDSTDPSKAGKRSAFQVTETVTNTAPLGRVYNMVQHPTIGPPFLDETTLVDCNGTRGISQDAPHDALEKSAIVWPRAEVERKPVDLRRLADDHRPNVTSFIIEEELGWVTAVHPEKRLLIGYVWKTKDYPWVNLWRHAEKGKPLARGLEFGTTGWHQPFGKLVKQGKLFDRPLSAWLDADESAKRSYVGFLVETPKEFRGVKSLKHQEGQLVLKEHGDDGRTLLVPVGPLP